jgi:hypothetical protein
MRHDLIFSELLIALRRACGDAFRCGFPLVDAIAHEVADRDLLRLDIRATADRG